MSREIMIIAKNKDGVISNNIVKIGENGQPIVIKGTKDTFYEIKDMATNRAPDQIYTKRFKNDLKLKINPKGGALDGAGEADVVIQDYCANGNCEIVGVHETGEYYQYVPQSGDAELMTTKMADGEFAYQSLGTVESSSWGPASLLPLAGLGGLGGGGGSKGDTTAPTAVPTIDAINDDVAPVTGVVAKGGHTNDTTPTLSGTLTEALGSGEVVAVYRDGVKVGNATVDASGTSWTFEDTGVTDGNHIYTTRAEDAAGNKGIESAPYDIIVDTMVPDAPSVTMVTDSYDAQSGYSLWGADVDKGSWSIDSATGDITTSGNVNVTSDGKIITNDNTPTFSGTGEVGTIVRIYDGDPDNPDNLVGETTVASDGNWSITTEELQDYAPSSLTYDDSVLQNIEHTLSITLTDTAGNVSNPTAIDIIVDTGLPLRNGEILIEDINGRNSRSSDLDGNEFLGENYYFTNEITLSDDYLKQLYNSSENIPYNEGDGIYITFINQTTGETYLIGGPDGPSVVVGSDGKWSVSIFNADTSDGTTNAATAYNITTGLYETLSDGKYEIDVLVYEPSGNTRALSIADLAIDTTAPTANEANYLFNQSNTNNITTETAIIIGGAVNDYQQLPYVVGGEDGDNIMERDQDYLIGNTAAEVFVYRDGVEIGHSYVGTEVNAYWQYTETSALTEGVYRYQVDTMDVAGNTSGLGDSFWVYIDADKNNTYNLTTADNDASKDFSNMVLSGNTYILNTNDTFILDNVGFKSIDAKDGDGDTFTLLGSGQTLDIAKATNFEVYNINGNMLTINGDVNADSNHIIINGTSSAVVDLSTDWSPAGTTQTIGSITYNVYSNNGSDDLWIQNTAVVNI